MDTRRLTVAALVAITLLVGAVVVGPELYVALVGQSSVEGDDATVTVLDATTGEVLGEVGVDVADSAGERYAGLSNVDELADDRGMLFVFDDEAERTFVMREMQFGLDIIFIDAEGRISAIHVAPAPEPGADGTDQRYTGTGELVLEVNRGWANAHDVSVGDRVDVEHHD